MTRHEPGTENDHPWFLPGESVKRTFDGDLDFCQANTYEPRQNESPKAPNSPLDPWPETLDQPGPGGMAESSVFGRSAKKTKAQLVQLPLVSFLAAAGNTLHGRAAQEASDPPHHHSRHISDRHCTPQGLGRGHERSQTYSQGEPCVKEPSLVDTANTEPARTRLVLTNFRICSLVRSPAGHDAVGIEVALGSIAVITLQDHRINIALKFDSPQFVIAQDPHGPPMVGEIMSCLRRFIFNDRVKTWFPYQMGQCLLEQSRKAEPEKKSSGHREGRLLTAEEIMAVPTKSKRKVPADDPHPEMSREEHEWRLLGWAGGYDIISEFQRLKFDETLW